MNTDKQHPNLDDLPMVEFVDDDIQPEESTRTYQYPPSLPLNHRDTVTPHGHGPPPTKSEPPVYHHQSPVTSSQELECPERVRLIEPRSLLLVMILIPYLWFMSNGVSRGNVPWGVVMLLAGGGLTLGWYGFLGLAKLSTKRGEELALRAVQVFLATAVIGVALLLLFQGALSLVDENWQKPVGGKRLVFLFAIIKILATGYHTAFTAGPLPNPLWYFLCTFVSVAFCEELLKLFPVLLISNYQEGGDTAHPENNYLRQQKLLFLGAMAGMGFGFSEALIYTADLYRPLQLGFSIYFLRFMGLVIMHGLWSFVSSAVYLRIQAQALYQPLNVIGLAIVGPMLLHALHNSASLYGNSELGLLAIILTLLAAFMASRTIRSLPSVQDPV
jgi:RsiW-degrading membrane proteinase PrsW (M82 family)